MRLKYLLNNARFAAENDLPLSCYWWLCKALGEANATQRKCVPQIMAALSLIRRHKDYRAI